MRFFSRRASLRARFARAFGALLALATVNVAAFTWGARQRAQTFEVLHEAVARHSALTEARTGLEDHAKRVKVVSDLFGVEHATLSRAERQATLRQVIAAREGVDWPAAIATGLA